MSIESETIAVMTGMYNLQERFSKLTLKERMKYRNYIEEINNRSGAVLFHIDDCVEKMEKDGMDIVNEYRNAGVI